MKKSAYILIYSTIFLGAMVPFAAQFLFPAIWETYSPAGAEVWNQYVSIILGIVATVLSIVSLILSFRSQDRSEKADLELKRTFENLNRELAGVGNNQKDLERRFTDFLKTKDSETSVGTDTPVIEATIKSNNDEHSVI